MLNCDCTQKVHYYHVHVKSSWFLGNGNLTSDELFARFGKWFFWFTLIMFEISFELYSAAHPQNDTTSSICTPRKRIQ